MEPYEKPGEFIFIAAFSCFACRVEHARCPPEFHETSYETFDTSTSERAAALAKAREFAAYVNARGCGFAQFVGRPGTGKTRLACNIIRELQNRVALYVRQGELTVALRATYGRKDRAQRHYAVNQELAEVNDEISSRDDLVQPVSAELLQRRDELKQELILCRSQQQPLQQVQETGFLVLDELGCTALANDERLMLDEVLKHRYEHRKPTILISNLPLAGKPDNPGLKEFLGDALTDRIREATGNGKFIVQFSGESYRRTAGESYLAGL